MANDQCPFDDILHYPILAANSVGTLEPAPSGDTYAVAANPPTSGVGVGGMVFSIGTFVFPAIGTTAVPSVDCTPAVMESDPGNKGGGFSFTLTDTAGLKSVTSPLIDIVPDTTPTQLEIGASATSANPTPPTAAGP